MWQQWLNGILGLWLVVLPFLNLGTGNALTWTLIVSGALVAALGFWGALERQGGLQ